MSVTVTVNCFTLLPYGYRTRCRIRRYVPPMSTPSQPDTHLLRQLVLPARYERLVAVLGADVAQLLVQPGESTKQTLERASIAARARGEGLFLPLFASSGTGKTTLASNLATFLGNDYAATITHIGDVSFDALMASAADGLPPPNDPRLLPINIDHREATPPNASELAEVKRFLRESDVGSRCAILWPQTVREQAERMAAEYEAIAGQPPVGLPVDVEGPAREAWPDIAVHTLRLSNQMIDSLELMGIDPHNYDPAEFRTLGEFLRRISDDFANHLFDLLSEVRIPVRLIIIFASESSDPGVLAQLTTGTRYGFVDANALLDATPNSAIGRFWSERRGLLTSTIVRLDARALPCPWYVDSGAPPVWRRGPQGGALGYGRRRSRYCSGSG
jgi:hypothetical protein